METLSFEQTRAKVRELVFRAQSIDIKKFEEICLRHMKFLETGGAGGSWKTYYINELIYGAYQHEGSPNTDLQASFFFYDLSVMPLSGIRLQYSNCATILCQAADWSHADLEGTLFIDSILNSCSFEYADLYAADFSRSEMKYCNFRGANLHKADFEDCDLTGADFENARIDDTTNFKGAILVNAKMPRGSWKQ